MQETTKYNFSFTKDALIANINRLTNQLWKLIPMRENNENWQSHLNGLLIELIGLAEIYNNSALFISLLSKLEGLQKIDIDFGIYRKTVFEAISLLRGVL